MHSLQPQSLTNDELERLSYISGFKTLPANWVQELLRRTEKNWTETKPQDPNQLELDLS